MNIIVYVLCILAPAGVFSPLMWWWMKKYGGGIEMVRTEKAVDARATGAQI